MECKNIVGSSLFKNAGHSNGDLERATRGNGYGTFSRTVTTTLGNGGVHRRNDDDIERGIELDAICIDSCGENSESLNAFSDFLRQLQRMEVGESNVFNPFDCQEYRLTLSFLASQCGQQNVQFIRKYIRQCIDKCLTEFQEQEIAVILAACERVSYRFEELSIHRGDGDATQNSDSSEKIKSAQLMKMHRHTFERLLEQLAKRQTELKASRSENLFVDTVQIESGDVSHNERRPIHRINTENNRVWKNRLLLLKVLPLCACPSILLLIAVGLVIYRINETLGEIPSTNFASNFTLNSNITMIDDAAKFEGLLLMKGLSLLSLVLLFSCVCCPALAQHLYNTHKK